MRLLSPLALLATCGLAATGCERLVARPVPPEEDEARIRAELRIPDGAALLWLRADPEAPGWFGREGLRVVARFEVPPARRPGVSRALRAAGWGALPLPATSGFRAPPDELPEVEEGLGLCTVGVHAGGQAFTRHPCATPPPRFDRYRAAVFDPRSGRLTVVAKNYY